MPVFPILTLLLVITIFIVYLCCQWHKNQKRWLWDRTLKQKIQMSKEDLEQKKLNIEQEEQTNTKHCWKRKYCTSIILTTLILIQSITLITSIYKKPLSETPLLLSSLVANITFCTVLIRQRCSHSAEN